MFDRLIAIDRDPISKVFAQEIKEIYSDKFNLVNGCFSEIDQLVKNTLSNEEKQIKFDIQNSSFSSFSFIFINLSIPT